MFLIFKCCYNIFLYTHNSLKLLPKKFLILPMFSINCQIVNVKKNENANDKDVIKELSRLLKAINLKIIVTVCI